MDAAALAADLIPRLRRWTADSWTRPATPPTTGDGVVSRGEAAAVAVQRIADVAADAEGQPRRTVPDLGDLVRADQLAVLVDDALRTGSPAAATAVSRELTALRTTLGLR